MRSTKPLKRTGFKQKPRTPLKRTVFKRRPPVKRQKLAKVELKSKRGTKPKVTGIRTLQKRLWAECKRIIRLRYKNFDDTWNCFTCGRTILEPKNAQTGHFIPSSVCSVHMRYSLDNLRIQCYHCNINCSGNWPAYEQQLKIEMGDDFPDTLKEENRKTTGLSYREDWYLECIQKYKDIV